MNGRTVLRRLAWLSAAALVVGLALQAEAQTVKIRYMDWKLNDSKEILELYQALVKDFEAKNPDIKVELAPVQWEQRMQKMMTEIQAGLPPDVARVSVVDMGGLFPLLQRVDVPLKALGVYDEIMSTIPPKFVEDNVVRNGAVYGVPAYITADGLMYNKRMFKAAGLDPDKPPKTWAEFLDYAKKLTRPPERYGYGMFGDKSGSTARRWLRVFWDAGCEFVSRDFKKAMLNSKPECIAAFKREIDYARVEKIVPPGATKADFEFVITAFAQERIAMHMGGPNNAVIANGRNPGIIEHLALVPMPATGAALAGGDANVIPAGTKNVVQAAKWIAFINSRDVQVKVGVVAKLGPSRNDARQAPEIQSDPFLSFRPPADALYAPYNTPKWGKLQTVLYDIVQSALLGDETPEEALKSGEKKLNAILTE